MRQRPVRTVRSHHGNAGRDRAASWVTRAASTSRHRSGRISCMVIPALVACALLIMHASVRVTHSGEMPMSFPMTRPTLIIWKAMQKTSHYLQATEKSIYMHIHRRTRPKKPASSPSVSSITLDANHYITRRLRRHYRSGAIPGTGLPSYLTQTDNADSVVTNVVAPQSQRCREEADVITRALHANEYT